MPNLKVYFALFTAVGAALLFAIAMSVRAESTIPVWGIVDSPNRGSRDNALLGLAINNPNDIWAVGEYNPAPPPNTYSRETLIEHWDGESWHIVPSPNPSWPGIDVSRLEAVDLLTTNDAWAVGYSDDVATARSNTLIQHWDGNSWQIVPSPNPAGDDQPNRLYDVVAIASDEVWAVGESGRPESGLLLRYDGSTWRTTSSFCRTRAFHGVGAAAPDYIWAVGSGNACRYNGTWWAPVKTPRPEGDEIGLLWSDVDALAPNDAWAVGTRAIPHYQGVTFASIVMHWDGSSWTADRNVPGRHLESVVMLAPDDVWAVGRDDFGAIMLHYDGTGWESVPVPYTGASDTLNAIDAIDRGSMWAVGYLLDENANYASRTLTINAPSTTSGMVVGDTNIGGAVVSWSGPNSGSTTTQNDGAYSVAGLPAGVYTFVLTHQGCSPDFATVEVAAGQSVYQELHAEC